MKRTLVSAILLASVLLAAPAASPALAVTLSAADVDTGPSGNQSSSTWQFFCQTYPAGAWTRIPSYVANPGGIPATGGWSGGGLETSYEGVWGNLTDGKVYAHPATIHGVQLAVAIEYLVTDSGDYTIVGGITDTNVNTYYKCDGVLWKVQRPDGLGGYIDVGTGGPVGDNAPQASATFSYADVPLVAGDLLRFVIHPNAYWGTDSTRIDSFSVTLQTPPLPVYHAGDANGDGVVDLQDFGALKDNFGLSSSALWPQGDFNSDAAIDLQDFGILKDHFGHTSGDTPLALPEPATFLLLALTASRLPPTRRRNSSANSRTS